MRNRMGPRTEPCGTPDVTGTGTVVDFSFSMTKAWIKMPGSI